MDSRVVLGLMEQLGGEELLHFVTPEYATVAQAVFDSLDITDFSVKNTWNIFQAMLPLMP